MSLRLGGNQEKEKKNAEGPEAINQEICHKSVLLRTEKYF